ncbi:MAG: rod shape-determining protein MreC [Burkholderiaceae bacterium]
MDRSPPPFFKQGPSANVRLAFFSLLAIALLIVDARFDTLSTLRQGIATVLYPAQRTLLMPRDVIGSAAGHFADIDRLQAENAEMRRIEAANARTLLQAEQLASENAQLRQLLGMRERTPVRTTVAEVMYDARNAFARTLVVDRGSQHGVRAGQPVIDAHGVVGQITRAHPLSSEITLVTDPNATVPIEIRRTGSRTLAWGGRVPGTIELRFLPVVSDIREGDELITSGLDGLFPAGLPVARVSSVSPGATSAFLHVQALPVAMVERTKLLLILLTDTAGPLSSAEAKR